MKRLASLCSLWLMTICVVCAQTTQVDSNTVKEPAVQYQEKINEVDVKSRDLEASFKELSAHVSCLEYVVDKQKDIIAQEQSAIENQLTASSRFLEIFSLILAVAGIVLSVYISGKEKSMKGLLENVTDKQKEITVLKTDIETTAQAMRDLDNEMKNNVNGLFQRLRRNDTVSLLERLVKVPEDIHNLESLLLARDLESEDFDMLLKAYRRLLDLLNAAEGLLEYELKTKKHQYLLLFFQNFCGKSIRIPDLREDLVEFFPTALRCAFQLDVKNSLLSLIEELNSTPIEGGNDIILTEYIIALNASLHRDYTDPYQLIINNCNENINLKLVWDELMKQHVTIIPFGNLLCEKYKEDTEFVNKVMEQIASLQQDKEDGKQEKPQES